MGGKKILTFPSEILHVQSRNVPFPKLKYLSEI